MKIYLGVWEVTPPSTKLKMEKKKFEKKIFFRGVWKVIPPPKILK